MWQNTDINMRMEINILHCIQNQENLLDISIRRLQKLSNNLGEKIEFCRCRILFFFKMTINKVLTLKVGSTIILYTRKKT